MDDVAQDVCGLLRTLEAEKFELESPDFAPDKQSVFLAFTTGDVTEKREVLRRDLQEHGHPVFPMRPLGTSLPEIESAIREDLRRCSLSVHLLGNRYGAVPEDSVESVPEIQNRLAVERGKQPGFTRLIWMPPQPIECSQEVRNSRSDERQKTLLERLRREIESNTDSDLLETPFEDLRTLLQDRLKPLSAQKPATPRVNESGQELVRVYFMYDQRDLDSVEPWQEFLFDRGLEIFHSMFEGDESDIRECQEENLRTCDAVLLYFGAANELWLRRKLREIQKVAALGRADPMRGLAIVVGPPTRSEKRTFRTHEAMVIAQMDGLSADAFAPFLAQITGGRRDARA